VHLDELVPEVLIGDSTRLTQILFNLVGNALKYTHNGEVRLEVSSLPGSRAAACRVLFRVSDTGPGIPDDQMDRIFDTFTQAEETHSPYSRQYEGAGLGLPLVKRLLDLMEGNAAVDSRLGEGTAVYVSLPFALPEKRQEPRQEGRSSSIGACYRVLLVDDDPLTQISIKRLLEEAGYHIEAVSNGQEALDLLKDKGFDCLLMDIQMPQLDGLEATRSIRSSAEYAGKAGMVIIALTAFAMDDDRQRFLDAGMDDYLAKPIKKEDLLEALQRNLENRSDPPAVPDVSE
jgi:CheY-like chemotaxis protein/anti-sigma regulatory factor (Ser/Thr protein kinase)